MTSRVMMILLKNVFIRICLLQKWWPNHMNESR